MIRFLIYAQLLFALISFNRPDSLIPETDHRILTKFWEYAAQNKLTTLPVDKRIPVIARFFIGTPYQSNTLDDSLGERLIINLHQLDCVTFVENVLALSFLPSYNDNAITSFKDNLIRFRYRKGEIYDYTSRLHYSSDWLYEMEKQHLLKDITRSLGGIPYTKPVFFMSKNFSRYPQLRKDSVLQEKIKTIETAINKRTYYYIPKDQIHKAYSHLKSGDIVLITTNIKGLDTSHLGFVWKENGTGYLLHASSSAQKVTLSATPLQEYMQSTSSQSGMMVARFTGQIPPGK